MQYVQFTFIHPDLLEQADVRPIHYLPAFTTTLSVPVYLHPTSPPSCRPFITPLTISLAGLQGAKASATCALVQQAKWPMTGLPNHNFAFSRAFPCPLLPSQMKICRQKTPCPSVSGGVVSAVFSLAEIGNV